MAPIKNFFRIHVFTLLTFQHYFLALALVPVLENSSNNPSIMLSKLFRGEQKLFYSFDVLLYEKPLHMHG